MNDITIPPEVRAAEDCLRRRGINIKAGVIYIPFDHEFTKLDVSAARYLLDEWDYAVEWLEKVKP